MGRLLCQDKDTFRHATCGWSDAQATASAPDHIPLTRDDAEREGAQVTISLPGMTAAA